MTKLLIMNDYYTYAYLRDDKTPYYIGKGRGNRAYCNHSRSCPTPKDRTRVLFLKKNLSEFDAYKHEIYMIAVLGRKDLGTGILRNLTDGGEGVTNTRRTLSAKHKRKIGLAGKGRKHSLTTRKKMSEAQRGSKNHNYGKPMPSKTKAKIGAKSRGRKHTPEALQKMSASQKGRPWTQAQRDARNAYLKSKKE